MSAPTIETMLAKANTIRYSPFGGIWEELPEHPVRDWQYEVANGDTRLGYWEWVQAQIEMTYEA
jgi:hypothetical protein